MKTTFRDTEEFANMLKEELTRQLDSDIYSIFIDKMPKNNQVKTGVCIRKENFGAVVYAEDILKDLKENPRPVEMVAREVIQCVIQNLQCAAPRALEHLLDWANVQDNIEFRLVNTDRNKELLASCPHRDFFDLSLIYYIALAGDGAARVGNAMMQHWGITEEDLFIAGCKAMRINHPVGARSMVSVIQEVDPGFAIEAPEDAVPLYVLGDSSERFLSSAIVYSDAVEELAMKYKADIYIIPSSVHELLLAPKFGEIDEMFLLQMVWAVNRTQVSEEDFLSDNIYVFRHESGKFDIIRQPE